MSYNLDAQASFNKVTFSQASPVQNTWYTVADLKNVEVLTPLLFQVTATGETLEIKVTIDGIVSSATGDSQVAVAGTQYIGHLGSSYDGGLYWTIDSIQARLGVEAFKAKAIKYEIRKTTAAGGGTINAGLLYKQA